MRVRLLPAAIVAESRVFLTMIQRGARAMKKIFGIAPVVLTLLGMTVSPTWAGHGCGHGYGPSWSIGIGLGPVYRPYYPYHPYYPYYYDRPYPVYMAPPTVIVQPAPVIQHVPVESPIYQAPPPRPLTAHASPAEGLQADVDYHLQMLTHADEHQRAESVMQLGRLKAQRAVDPLAATLSGDSSPVVRETAARALGLIGSAQALPALQHAAQSDSDRDVRRSAQFAAEVIQSRN